MEEVKDEKLREELLRRVVKGEGDNVEKSLKRIEHRLKAQDSLAKQEIMHGRTEKIAKIEWWGELIAAPFDRVVFGLILTGVILFWAHLSFKDFAKMPKFIWFLLGIVWLLIIVDAIIQVYFLLEGKKEYERRKKEEEELER
jgi:hypothetical protein